jgi:hypothetical protein
MQVKDEHGCLELHTAEENSSAPKGELEVAEL